MKKRLKITVLVDWATVPDHDVEFRDETPTTVTEYHVIHTLRQMGHVVSVASAREDVCEMVSTIRNQSPDVIFNLTEEFRGIRQNDKCIAGVLDMLDVPYTGAGVAGLLLCRDKGLSKQLLSHHRIGVPQFTIFPVGGTGRVKVATRFPAVVKPMLTDGSEGIADASLVSTPDALRERVRFVHEHWQQPAIAEEYIPGREIYVSVLGNKRLQVLPPRELFFDAPTGGPVLATYRVKWDRKLQERWKISFGFAELDGAVLGRMSRLCRRAYHALHMRDYCRIDLRLTPEGRIVILEVNPNADIAHGEEIAEAASKAGIDYEALLDRIVRMPLRR